MKLLLAASFLLAASAFAERVQVSSISTDDLVEFDAQPSEIQALIRYSLGLTTKKLRYEFGSCDPKNGGMDCSGTVYHVLRSNGIDATPRQSSDQYLWAKDKGTLTKVKAFRGDEDKLAAHLRPGDLLFWEGTYNVGKRNPPISHVMIYLGREKSTGKPVMVGASSGRYYAGKARHGVSVFDLQLPGKTSQSKFVAYGRIPGLEGVVPAAPPTNRNLAGALFDRLRDLDGDGE